MPIDNREIDPYSQLKLEFKSIKATINDYTSQGAISEYINALESAIYEINEENILYYLSRIKEWYDANLIKILKNSFVPDEDQRMHTNIKLLIESMLDRFENYDFSRLRVQSSNIMEKQGTKRIFISHSSKDKKYGDSIEKLICGLNIKDDQLIYTSHPLHKIPLGKKIYDYLRENINDQVFIIILWSNNYLESPACLAEMGAAWVLQSKCISLFTPDFSFGNPKYHGIPLDQTEMGAVLNGDEHCKTSMSELIDKVLDFFDLKIEDKKRMFLIDQFIKDISQ